MLRKAGLFALCVALITTLFFAHASHAATGINQTMNFQGRLSTAAGGVVPDGYYNIQFKIYQDGTGTSTGDTGGTLKWTETYINNGGTGGVQVKDGYFSVSLGSLNPFGTQVDWNQDTLWLSMNVAGSATACTTFNSGSCAADGEMLPMKRIDSVPYAMNAGTVGGKSASDLIQNGTTQQTADFNISGTGTATTLQGNTSIITPLLDTQNTGDVLSIGTTKAGGVTIGKTNGTNTIYGGTTMNGPLTLGGTSTTNFAMSVSQTLNSAFTTSIEGIQNQLNINPQGATLSNLYGMVNLPVISGGSAAIANAFGMYTRLDTTSGFTGTIDTGNGLTVGGPNLGSSGDANGIKIGTYSGLNIGGASQNGGNTSGTITNYGIQLQGNTATAGVGGTVNNLGISIVMPSGGAAGTGTTKNIGLNLSGNGNTNATNWAIYSSSTASSYLQGNVMIGTGSNPNNYALNVSGTANASALYAPTVDTASAGTLTVGGTNATGVVLGQNTTVAAGKSLTVTGGATSTRPASPTEGMIYYDTDTKQLLTYSNGKWQSDRTTATKIVAASNSSQSIKDGADFVADGTDDQVQINAALTAAAGGTVYLAEGTYTITASLSVPNNTTLAGAGTGTVITIPNGLNTSIDAITNATTGGSGSGIVIRDLKLDGNRANQTAVTLRAIYFNGVGSGTGAAAVEGGTISGITATNWSIGADLNSSSNTTVTALTAKSNATGIKIDNGGYNTIRNNTIRDGNYGININASTYNTITGNTVQAIGPYVGILVTSGSDNTITGNTISDTTGYGISISSGTSHNTIGGNTLHNNTTDLQDNGTNTVYINQLDSTGKLINKSAAGLSVTTNTNTANAFTVQNTSSASVLAVNTDDSSVLVAGRLDTTTAATLTIGNANASAIAIGNPTTSITNSIYGSTILKSASDGTSPVVFQLQQANGTPMLTADSSAQSITIGNATSGDKMVISTANGQVTYYGSARRTKNISLSPEYNNSVLDAGTGSSNTGTMTSSVDLTNRMNYYKWTTNQSSNQSYDVDVQIPLPTDFDGWASSNPLAISTYTSDTTNGTITLEARDSSNAVQCNFVAITPGSTGTWSTNSSACTLASGTYTAGNYITLRIRMQSPNGGDVRVGNITLSYLSKF